MKRAIRTGLLGMFLLWNLSACHYHVEEELFPPNTCNTVEVSYSAFVLPLLENSCYVCHDAANDLGGITLEGYDQLINHVNSGRFLGAIRHDDGFSPMPQDQAKIDDCSISKIEAWINDGAPDN